MQKQITIIDYKCGNLKSVENAVKFVGAIPIIATSPDEILRSEKILLPGVGSFPAGMAKLSEMGLVKAIIKKAAEQTPLLGICLGMQLLFEHSEEHGGASGLGLMKGKVVRMTSQSQTVKLPHVGWNCIQPHKNSLVFGNAGYCYFVHSYKAVPDNPEDCVAFGQYEDIKFPAAVQCGNIYGSQFHPENSGQLGLDMLNQFSLL